MLAHWRLTVAQAPFFESTIDYHLLLTVEGRGVWGAGSEEGNQKFNLNNVLGA